MPHWLRANLLLLALFVIAAAVLWFAHLAVRRLGLLANEQRYVMAVIGLIVVIANYLIAKRLVRSMTRLSINKR